VEISFKRNESFFYEIATLPSVARNDILFMLNGFFSKPEREEGFNEPLFV